MERLRAAAVEGHVMARGGDAAGVAAAAGEEAGPGPAAGGEAVWEAQEVLRAAVRPPSRAPRPAQSPVSGGRFHHTGC